MYLTALSLTNFRSYRSLDLGFEPGLTVIWGDNAQGKSNLLEAIYLLAVGKSSRAIADRELVSWEAADAGGYAMVVGTVARSDGPVELRVGLDCRGAQPGSVQKRVRINGAPKRASELVGALNAVLFSADDHGLVHGPPQGRRRYLDVMLAQTDGHYVRALQRYQHVLVQRNAVLRGLRERHAGESEMAFWDSSLCAEGATLLGARHDALQRLVPLIADAFAQLGGTESVLRAEYVATAPADGRPTPETMAAALARTGARERAIGMTVVGPHRDDLRLVLNGHEMVRHASRGQARLAALSLRLAEGRLLHERRDDAPILLLDDVLSELDERRRDLVLGEVSRYPQALISTAEPALLPPERVARVRWLRVRAGEVLEEAAA